VRSGMLANLGAGDVDNVAWPTAEAPLQESGSVSVGDEADVVTVGLVRHSETTLPGLGAYLALARETERKKAPAKLIMIQYAQHVGLILVDVDGSMQLDIMLGTDQPGIVTRADGIEAERDTALQNSGELDLLVAAHAGIRGTPGGILSDEVAHHISGEAVREIPYVEGNAEHICGPASIVRIFDGAAAAGTRTIGLRVLGQG